MDLHLHLKKKEGIQKHKHFSWNPVHPRRDWQYLFVIFMVLALSIGAWSGYLFLMLDQPQEITEGHHFVDHGSTEQVQRISTFFEKRVTTSTPSI